MQRCTCEPRACPTGSTFGKTPTPPRWLRSTVVDVVDERELCADSLVYPIASRQPSWPENTQFCQTDRRPALAGKNLRAFKSEGQLQARPLPPLPPQQPQSRKALPLPNSFTRQLDEVTRENAQSSNAQEQHQRQDLVGCHGWMHQGSGGGAQQPLQAAREMTREPLQDCVTSAPVYQVHCCGHSVPYSTESESSSTISSTTTSTDDTITSGSLSSLMPPPPRSVRDVATGMETSPLESRKWDKHLALVPAVAVLAALLIVLTLGTVATIKSVASNPVDKRIPDGESGLALPKPFGPEAPPPGPPLLPDAPSMPDEAVTSGTNTDTEEKAVVSGVDFSSDLDVMRIPFRRPAKPECGAVLYTYCSEAHREFHYRASLNACVSSEPGAVLQLCSRGSNRFASLRDCEGSCVHAQPPLEACLEKTLFTTCRRQDVNSGSWWWFDGKACLAWDFPEGGCPDNGSAVFTTAELCMSRCTNPRYPPCTAPRAVPCPSGQLKFPYFAVGCPLVGQQGFGRRCVRLSASVVTSRRCLTGANRFPSRTACEEACKKPAKAR